MRLIDFDNGEQPLKQFSKLLVIDNLSERQLVALLKVELDLLGERISELAFLNEIFFKVSSSVNLVTIMDDVAEPERISDHISDD